MRRLALFALVIPSIAVAQPAPYPPPQQPPPQYPPPQYPPPQQPPPQYPPPQPGPPGYPPGYAAPSYPQPGYAQPPPPLVRNGLTVELNVGIGFLHASANGGSSNSDALLGGLDIGVGGWLNPRTALSGRIAGVTDHSGSTDTTSSALFIGPSLQYWANEHTWVGGGAGLARIAVLSSGNNAPSESGFGIDLRAGYTFSDPSAQSSFNVSVEITPGFFSDYFGTGISVSLTGFALLFGYQYL